MGEAAALEALHLQVRAASGKLFKLVSGTGRLRIFDSIRCAYDPAVLGSLPGIFNNSGPALTADNRLVGRCTGGRWVVSRRSRAR